MAVSNFSPKFLLLLLKGAEEPVDVILPTKAKAYQLRRLLYGLRAEMRKEFHPLLETVEMCEIRLHELQSGEYQMTVQPTGGDFEAELAGAGIDLGDESVEEARRRLGMVEGLITGQEKLSREWEGSSEDQQDAFIKNLFDKEK